MEWRIVEDFTDYAVSSEGQIKRIHSAGNIKASNAKVGRILKQARNKNSGYLYVALSLQRQRRTLLVHRLVAQAFLGPCPKGKEVNHKDGNKENNRVENLEYLTPKENMRHARQAGLFPVQIQNGEHNHNARLTEFQVERIRELLYADYLTQGQIGDMFGVSNSTISMISCGRTWSV